MVVAAEPLIGAVAVAVVAAGQLPDKHLLFHPARPIRLRSVLVVLAAQAAP